SSRSSKPLSAMNRPMSSSAGAASAAWGTQHTKTKMRSQLDMGREVTRRVLPSQARYETQRIDFYWFCVRIAPARDRNGNNGTRIRHSGDCVRLNKDGAPASGNPFADRPGVLPEIWSYGHRNPQGAAIAPDGTLWIHEHGPQGGDEINLPQAGRNYGWPVITYGENYGGGPIGEGITRRDGMEQPLHYWVPSIAPSGMAFLTSDRYGEAMKGNLFIGSLKFGFLDRIELAQGKVVREHRLLAQERERIRDVRQGPDGWLYVLTDSPRGRLLRVVPR
ncbi:MAG: PQQ-dependent sugar dehydrogenase, partial [Ramlibacter sp.]|nr:PQQ-dependent sugar dehydrogenase [Ramlibacter sp.]